MLLTKYFVCYVTPTKLLLYQILKKIKWLKLQDKPKLLQPMGQLKLIKDLLWENANILLWKTNQNLQEIKGLVYPQESKEKNKGL